MPALTDRIGDVAGELYSLPPDGFIPRRDEVAAQAKADGDKELAAAIKKLPKPGLAAWVVNMVVRHEADQVTQVLELGASLRRAQASMEGDALRELGRQRRQLIAAVTRQARALAADLGQKVGGPVASQVEDTLHAAMVDETAAAAVRSGLLVKPLSATGVDSVDISKAMALPELLGVVTADPVETPAPHRPELTVVRDNSRAIEDARTAVSAAEKNLSSAQGKLDKAQRRLEKREARALQLEAELEELRRRLAEVEAAVEANEEELTEAEELRDERRDEVEEAQAELAEAKTALEQLD